MRMKTQGGVNAHVVGGTSVGRRGSDAFSGAL